MWGILRYIYSLIFGSPTTQEEYVEPQTSPEPKTEETISSEHLSEEGKYKISLPEPPPVHQLLQDKEQRIKMVEPTIREKKAEVHSPESKAEEIPPVGSKHLSEKIMNSTTEPSVYQVHLKETNGKNTDEEKDFEPQATSSVPETEAIPPNAPKRLSNKVKDESLHLKSSSESLPVYLVPLEDEQINISGCRRYRFGNDNLKPNRTIMVMGATGAGKSTLIDGMINYILGIKWNDNYRFKLVREVQKETQAESQTFEVTVYKLNHQEGFQVNYSLTLIDTPGFGDTRGIKRDMEITEKIRNLFKSPSSQVLELDAVCFVVQSALARLTPSQKYVFDSVLSIFGKDIAENIRVLVTFADGQRPPVLEAIVASGVPCPEENGAPLHFKFNNSALFASNSSAQADDSDNESFDQMFWKMGNKSMKRFFAALNLIQPKSLTLTKEVLSERKQLENIVENLQKQVRVGLAKLEEIKQTSEILQTHEAEINRNAKFEYEITVTEPHQILKKEDTFITNCQQCSYTCHDDCLFANDEDKKRCGAMGQDGRCTVCPGNCNWNVHFNQKYKWDYREVTKKETIQDLKDKYDIATGEKNTVEVLMKKLEDDYEEVQTEVTVMMDRSSASLSRLKEIALKPDPLSTPDYIDMLIEGEKSEAKPGWKNRVESLMEMKQHAEYMAKVDRGEILLVKKQRRTPSKPSFLTRLKTHFSW